MTSMSTHHLDKADSMNQICKGVSISMQLSSYSCVYLTQIRILLHAVEYQWFFLIEGMQMSILLFESMYVWYTILLGFQNTHVIGKGCIWQIFGY